MPMPGHVALWRLIVLATLAATVRDGGGDDPPPPLMGSWVAVLVAGDGELSPSDPQVRSEVTLGEGLATGSGGVNRFRAAFESVDEATIGFGPIASTRMAGPVHAMAQERDFFSALEGAVRFEVTEDALVLRDEGDRTLLVLTRVEPPPSRRGP
jgi:heat shock protein HslJ